MIQTSPDPEATVESPIRVPFDPIDNQAPLRWTTTTIATASLFLAVFNAPVVAEWLDDLPQSPAIEALRPPTESWQRTTAAYYTPREWLRDRWDAARNLRFGQESPGEQGANDAP